MTPQEMIDVIQAYADGKKLQWRKRSSWLQWADCEEPTFNFWDCSYRVKPLELRPHWPAIVLSMSTHHVLISRLFASEDEAHGVIGFVRLATEYPPVMLP